MQILQLAAVGSESDVAGALEFLLSGKKLPSSDSVRRICEKPKAVPNVEVLIPNLDDYDSLLTQSNSKRG